MLQMPAVLSVVAMTLAAGAAPARAVEPSPLARQAAPAEPRVVPVDPRDEEAWTAEVRTGIESFGVDHSR